MLRKAIDAPCFVRIEHREGICSSSFNSHSQSTPGHRPPLAPWCQALPTLNLSSSNQRFGGLPTLLWCSLSLHCIMRFVHLDAFWRACLAQLTATCYNILDLGFLSNLCHFNMVPKTKSNIIRWMALSVVLCLLADLMVRIVVSISRVNRCWILFGGLIITTIICFKKT